MNRHVVMEVPMTPWLLYQFRLAAWRSNQNPSLLLRKMMRDYAALESNSKSIDLSVVSNSCRPSQLDGGADVLS